SSDIADYRVGFYLAEEIRSVAIAGTGKHSKDASKDVYKKLESLMNQGSLPREFWLLCVDLSQKIANDSKPPAPKNCREDHTVLDLQKKMTEPQKSADAGASAASAFSNVSCIAFQCFVSG